MLPPKFRRLLQSVDADVLRGLRYGALAGVAVLVASLFWRTPTQTTFTPQQAFEPAQPTLIHRQLDLNGQTVGPDAQRLLHWVVDTGDNGPRPFVVLDKRQAQLLVFEASGRLIEASPVLLGYARGDDSVPGIGDRAIEDVKPAERTTPAGRFEAQRGRNTLGEDVVWVDYNAAVSMHRVRLTDPAERRAERLATPTATDNRISYGCVNVPVAFFDQVLWPVMQAKAGVVYVLPEEKTLESVFPALAARTPYAVQPAD